MNFSTKMRYGTRAMLDIARTAGTDGGVTIAAIAESQKISQKYLESLLVLLKNKDLLKSMRGKKGGYSLKRLPRDIAIYDIFISLEGPLCLVDCCPGEKICSRREICETSDLWRLLNDRLEEEMKKISLEDLLEGRIKDWIQWKIPG